MTPVATIGEIALNEQDAALLDGKRVIVVMPAFNAAQTLEMTWREIPGRLGHADHPRR